MSNFQIPFEGDYVIFEKDYTAVRGSWSYHEIAKGTVARIAQRSFSSTGSDEADCILVIAVIQDDELMFFNFNYSLHIKFVRIIPHSQAAEILYDKSKI